MRDPKILLAFVACLTAMSSCTRERERETEPEAEIPEETRSPGGEAAERTTLAEGFSAPESALHDPEQDVYFVSNVNGKPTDKDDNGYISRIDPGDGGREAAIDARWIDGAREEVTLNGPKGLALVAEELWVADIDAVRRFDRRTGEQKGEIPVPDAIFLNDLAAGADGPVYASDSGMEGKTEGSAQVGMDSIYRIRREDNKAEKIASGQHLHRPNGMVLEGSDLWVVTFGSNELYRMADGEKSDVTELPQGSLDGLVLLDGGSFLVSSWDANGIYRGARSGSFELLLDGINSPADIGFDAKRRLLLIPQLTENEVTLYPVEP